MRIDGILTAVETAIVREMTSLRAVPGVLTHSELIILAEQKLLPEDQLRRLAEEAYGVTFTKHQPSFLSKETIDHYRGSGFIPMALRMQSQDILLVTIPEYKDKLPPPYGNYKHEIVLITPYDYHLDIPQNFPTS